MIFFEGFEIEGLSEGYELRWKRSLLYDANREIGEPGGSGTVNWWIPGQGLGPIVCRNQANSAAMLCSMEVDLQGFREDVCHV
jgi:hypothetical protein